MSKLTTLEHENLSSTVYNTLCDALTQGQFQPGDRLRIRDLADQLGTSVTPVRDAILRLSHDDAVVFQTARNIQIPVVTEVRYLEIRAIRRRLEAYTAGVAAEMASRSDIASLKSILDNNEIALKDADYLQCTRLNQAFHFELTTIARQPVLQGILRRLWLQMGPLIAQVYVRGGRVMIDQHYAIVEAIERGEAQKAANAMVDDIMLGGEVMLPFLATNDEEAASPERPE